MPRSLPIETFQPRWLAEGGPLRYQMGVSLLCPTHWSHRISLWFDNPGDGEAPTRRPVKLFHRTGGGLIELTVTHRSGGGGPLEIKGHWSGYIVGGIVSTARHTDDETTDPGIALK